MEIGDFLEIYPFPCIFHTQDISYNPDSSSIYPIVYLTELVRGVYEVEIALTIIPIPSSDSLIHIPEKRLTTHESTQRRYFSPQYGYICEVYERPEILSWKPRKVMDVV